LVVGVQYGLLGGHRHRCLFGANSNKEKKNDSTNKKKKKEKKKKTPSEMVMLFVCFIGWLV